MKTRALVVDDHPAFRSAARRLLEAVGCEVVGEASDAAAAVLAADELRPDLVLLDVRLPDGDGFAVARVLRGRSSALTLLVSSRSDPGYEALAVASGAVGFLPKDALTPQTLTSLLEGWRP